MKISYGKYSF